MGGRAAGAAVYLPPLCHAISRGLNRQIEYERTGLVGGKQFGRGEIKAMIKKLIAKIRPGGKEEVNCQIHFSYENTF